MDEGFSGLSYLFLVLISCTDPAKMDYEACIAAEAKGDYANASAACTRAKLAGPESADGKLAAEKLPALQTKIDEATKAKAEADEKAAETHLKTGMIDLSWCAGLQQRLDARYRAEAKREFPDRDPGFVAQAISESVQDDYETCTEDVGKRIAPYWECRWKSGGDGRKKCRDLRHANDGDGDAGDVR